MSAPISHRKEEQADREEPDRPGWINPCGLPSDFVVTADSQDGESDSRTEQKILTSLKFAAELAKGFMETFREQYVKDTFNLDLSTTHLLWQDSKYDWLPAVPKKFGEDITDSLVMDELTLDEMLRWTYESLQKFSAGLEQVILDQTVYDGGHVENFRMTEKKVRQLLCELQISMWERHLQPNSDITREVVTAEFRDIEDATHRNLRDWIIFRDLMNLMEYSVAVFERKLVRRAEQI